MPEEPFILALFMDHECHDGGVRKSRAERGFDEEIGVVPGSLTRQSIRQRSLVPRPHKPYKTISELAKSDRHSIAGFQPSTYGTSP
jgi:hypothetical protein